MIAPYLADELQTCDLTGLSDDAAQAIEKALTLIYPKYIPVFGTSATGSLAKYSLRALDPDGEHLKGNPPAELGDVEIIFNRQFANPDRIHQYLGHRIPVGIEPHLFVTLHEIGHTITFDPRYRQYQFEFQDLFWPRIREIVARKGAYILKGLEQKKLRRQTWLG